MLIYERMKIGSTNSIAHRAVNAILEGRLLKSSIFDHRRRPAD